MSSGASTSDPTAKALALAKKALGTVRDKFAALSRPAKVMLFSTIAAAVLITGYVGWRSSETTWATLFANMEREDAAAVVAKLKEMKVPYRLEGEGGTIEVPQANVRELRLELAGAGLPRGGGVGFESFDKLRLGATEFEQRVLYRQSLEGELSRTIDTIASVQSSRVHLVLPERSVFVGRAEAASASIVLKLRPGRVLGASEVAGVVHLVSSSVGSLTPDHIAVVTTEGTVLHKPRRTGEGGGDVGPDGDEQTSAARNMESSLEERARSMLEKVVGAGHVDVRVSAELDHSRTERVEDRYDPNQRTALRSEQSSTERSQPEVTATGVPGSESNLPDGTSKSPDGGAPVAIRESHTRNFEVDHITEKRLVTGGALRRLTVAVVVDRGKEGPRSKEDMDRLSALVRGAVGADDKRGDVVTVESVPFLETEAPAAPEAKPLLPPIPEAYRKYVPIAMAAGGVVVLLAVALTVASLRKRAKRAREAKAVIAAANAAAAAALVVAPREEVVAKVEEEKLAPEELRTLAHDRAAEDPATAALVLRFWLGEATGDRAAVMGKALAEGTRLA